MIALFTRNISSLIPADEDAEELIKKLPRGEIVTVEVKRPRNLRWHKKYWVLCSIIANNLDGKYNKEVISDLICLRTGHANIVKTKKGIVETPKSISFSAMTQDEFEAFWERAVQFVCEEIIPGLKSEDLEREVLELVN